MSGSKIEYFKKLQQIKVPKSILKLLFPIRVILGLFLIVFGVVGIILPGLPGWTPLILGVMIISPKHGKKLAVWVYAIFKKYIVPKLKHRKLFFK